MEFKNWLYIENRSPIAYHVTYYCYLDSISNTGLDFEQLGGSNYFKPHLISNSQQGTFFVTNIEGVKHWIGVMEDQAAHRSDDIYEDGFIPVILKFNLNKNKYQPDAPLESTKLSAVSMYGRLIQMRDGAFTPEYYPAEKWYRDNIDSV